MIVSPMCKLYPINYCTMYELNEIHGETCSKIVCQSFTLQFDFKFRLTDESAIWKCTNTTSITDKLNSTSKKYFISNETFDESAYGVAQVEI